MAILLSDGKALKKKGCGEQFRMSGWVETSPFEDLLGIAIEKAEGGRAVLTMPFTVQLAQGLGLMHGGALTTLADTAVAMAIKSLLPPNTMFATTELRMRFLAPVRCGVVTAAATVKGPEGRTFTGEAALADEDGREIATFTTEFRIARGQGFED